MDRRKEKKIGAGQDILYFDFIAGFNNNLVGEEIIPKYK